MRLKVCNYVFILFSFFLYTQCSNNINSKNDDNSIKVNATNPEKGSLESQIDSVSFIPLETNDSCLIGNIKKVLVYNNRVFISDFLSNYIYMFDMQGNFKRRISKSGKGPGENIRIDDFDICPKDTQITILDNLQNKIIKFDFQGNFKSEIRFPQDYGARFFAYLDNLLVFEIATKCKEDSCFRIMMTNYSLKVNSTIIKDIKDKGIVMGSSCNFQRYKKNCLNYIPPFSSIIYSIDKSGIETKTIFDFGNFNISNKKFFQDPLDFKKDIDKGDHICFFNAFENDSLILFYYFIKRNRYNGIYSKKSKIARVYKSNEEESKDRDLLPLSVYNNLFVSFIDPANGEQFFKRFNFEDNKKVSLHLSNNPIIIFTKYKLF